MNAHKTFGLLGVWKMYGGESKREQVKSAHCAKMKRESNRREHCEGWSIFLKKWGNAVKKQMVQEVE